MGHRLSKIYTRTGDDGTTGLANGERVEKTDARVGAFGDVDETNSALGLLLAEKDLPPSIMSSLTRIQHELFEIGAELSLPGYRQITAEHLRPCMRPTGRDSPRAKKVASGSVNPRLGTTAEVTPRSSMSKWEL